MSACDVIDESALTGVICPAPPDMYGGILKALLPPGAAWRAPEGSNLDKLYGKALAKSFTRLHDRSCDLLREGFPCSADETLDDWARVFGLPDGCSSLLCEDESQACLSDLCGDEASRRVDFQDEVCARAMLAFNPDSLDVVALGAMFGLELELIEEQSAMDCAPADCGDLFNAPVMVRTLTSPCGKGPCIEHPMDCPPAHEPICPPNDFELAVMDGGLMDGGVMGSATGYCLPYFHNPPTNGSMGSICCDRYRVLSHPPAYQPAMDCAPMEMPFCFIPGFGTFNCLVQKMKPSHKCIRFEFETTIN